MNARAYGIARIAGIAPDASEKPLKEAGDLDPARGLILAVAVSAVLWGVVIAFLVI